MHHSQQQHSNRALDLRSGFPRSGRDMLAGFAWLGRMADKARAKRAEMLGDYISLCPMDKGFLSRAGVPEDEFIELIARGVTDEELGMHFERHVGPANRKAANEWVLVSMRDHLDTQDREERHAA
jgi:uncharacterized protein DUF5069